MHAAPGEKSTLFIGLSWHKERLTLSILMESLTHVEVVEG